MSEKILILVTKAVHSESTDALTTRIGLAGGQSTIVDLDGQTIFLSRGNWYFQGGASNDELVRTVTAMSHSISGFEGQFVALDFDGCGSLRGSKKST